MFTVIVAWPLVSRYVSPSFGVKRHSASYVPASGVVSGFTQLNVPSTSTLLTSSWSVPEREIIPSVSP